MKKEKNKKINWLSVLKILLGSFLLALGLDIFLAPSNIVTGGVTGIGIIIKDITRRIWGVGISLSVTIRSIAAYSDSSSLGGTMMPFR